MYEIVESPMPY